MTSYLPLLTDDELAAAEAGGEAGGFVGPEELATELDAAIRDAAGPAA